MQRSEVTVLINMYSAMQVSEETLPMKAYSAMQMGKPVLARHRHLAPGWEKLSNDHLIIASGSHTQREI
jgi:hypothetical protein